jgi:hypothetical protein
MGYERLAWIGNLILAGIAIVLAWVPLRADVGKWGTVAIAVLVVAAAIAVFPRRRADGSTARLVGRFRTTVKGNNNVQIARDNANQLMGDGRIKGYKNQKR